MQPSIFCYFFHTATCAPYGTVTNPSACRYIMACTAPPPSRRSSYIIVYFTNTSLVSVLCSLSACILEIYMLIYYTGTLILCTSQCESPVPPPPWADPGDSDIHTFFISMSPPSFAPFIKSESPLFPTGGGENLFILNVRTAP